MRLFTVGHSNHPLPDLINLLESNGISVLVDVRTSPYSRYNPQYNREPFDASLQARQIQYVFGGQYLGGRPFDRSCYKSGALPPKGADYLHEVDYRAVMQRPWFQKAVAQLVEMAGEQTTAILCSEENPAECHRHHLIALYLLETYPEVTVLHIRGDGAVFDARELYTSVDAPSHEQLGLF